MKPTKPRPLYCAPEQTVHRLSEATTQLERDRVWDGTPTHRVAAIDMSGDGRTFRYHLRPRVT